MEGEFEQIMTKIRWSIKENSNYITAELQVLLTFILYFLQILGVYFYPIQILRFTEPYCGTITEPVGWNCNKKA